MKSKVVLIPCDSYDEDKVYAALRSGLTALGGIHQFVKPEEKLLVKPNFLNPSDINKAVATHPVVTSQFLRILQEEGYAQVKYGDSPGIGSCKAVAEKLGLTPANTYGATLAPMNEDVLTPYPEGSTAKEFHFCKDVVEADAIIGLCKMKSHALERITGGIKNMYGLICGTHKSLGHVHFPNDTIFARQLADIHNCVKPRLHIMDGIIAMEGNGPNSGDPTPMNVILMSADPVAMDTVFCKLINLNPDYVPTCSQGQALGVGTCREEEIELILKEAAPADSGNKSNEDNPENVSSPAGVIISFDEAAARFGNPNFDISRGRAKPSLLTNFSRLTTRFARRPYIDKKLCVHCGICAEHCPVPGKALSFAHGKDEAPVYDYTKCIRCYCCQELCPQKAIKVKGR